MPNLKKVISLHQASEISGYHQDYLSALIRKGEMKGEKIGGSWFTTLDEIENYIFKQKIRNKNIFSRHILFFARTNRSFIYAFILILIISTGIYFYNKQYTETKLQATETENSLVNNLAEREDSEIMISKELKF